MIRVESDVILDQSSRMENWRQSDSIWKDHPCCSLQPWFGCVASRYCCRLLNVTIISKHSKWSNHHSYRICIIYFFIFFSFSFFALISIALFSEMSDLYEISLGTVLLLCFHMYICRPLCKRTHNSTLTNRAYCDFSWAEWPWLWPAWAVSDASWSPPSRGMWRKKWKDIVHYESVSAGPEEKKKKERNTRTWLGINCSDTAGIGSWGFVASGCQILARDTQTWLYSPTCPNRDSNELVGCLTSNKREAWLCYYLALLNKWNPCLAVAATVLDQFCSYHLYYSRQLRWTRQDTGIVCLSPSPEACLTPKTLPNRQVSSPGFLTMKTKFTDFFGGCTPS